MDQKEINKMIDLRYQKWSKVSLKIGIVAFIISFILIVLNTGQAILQFISSIGLIVAISCLVEYVILTILTNIMLKKK